MDLSRFVAVFSHYSCRVAYTAIGFLGALTAAAYDAFCSAPERLSPVEINKLLIRFLAHVPNHIAAASKLLTGFPVTDVFGVGSTTDADDI